MLKRLAKRVLPESLHSGARSVRWWARFLFAAVIWRLRYGLRGALFSARDAWHRVKAPSLRSIAFDDVDAPDVSVVVPVHNQYRFTARCLRSLAAAGTERSYEVIVVDDSSTDVTADRLARVPGLRMVAN